MDRAEPSAVSTTVSKSVRGASLALDTGIRDQLAPFGAFAPNKLRKRVGRGWRRFGAECADFLGGGGIIEGFDEGGVQFADNVRRRADGRHQAEPADGL